MYAYPAGFDSSIDGNRSCESVCIDIPSYNVGIGSHHHHVIPWGPEDPPSVEPQTPNY